MSKDQKEELAYLLGTSEIIEMKLENTVKMLRDQQRRLRELLEKVDGDANG